MHSNPGFLIEGSFDSSDFDLSLATKPWIALEELLQAEGSGSGFMLGTLHNVTSDITYRCQVPRIPFGAKDVGARCTGEMKAEGPAWIEHGL